MSGRLWLVGGAIAALVLLLGVLLLFGLIIGLNGYSEAKGGAILLAYLVLFVVTLGLALWGGVAGVRVAAARTGWPFWLVGPLGVLAAVLAALGLLLLGTLILLVATS